MVPVLLQQGRMLSQPCQAGMPLRGPNSCRSSSWWCQRPLSVSRCIPTPTQTVYNRLWPQRVQQSSLLSFSCCPIIFMLPDHQHLVGQSLQQPMLRPVMLPVIDDSEPGNFMF